MTTINTSQLISSYSALIKRTENSIQNLPTGKLYAQINKKKYPQYYQFIFTMESSQKAVDFQLVDLLISKYFL